MCYVFFLPTPREGELGEPPPILVKTTKTLKSLSINKRNYPLQTNKNTDWNVKLRETKMPLLCPANSRTKMATEKDARQKFPLTTMRTRLRLVCKEADLRLDQSQNSWDMKEFTGAASISAAGRQHAHPRGQDESTLPKFNQTVTRVTNW